MRDRLAKDEAEKWATANLGEVATCTLGGTPSTEVPQFWGGSVPWMASGDVHLRRIHDVPGRITVAGLAASNATLVPPPAVAVGLAGQGKTRGTVALTLCELSTNQSIALLRGDAIRLQTEYLFHNLDWRYEELRARSSGGGRGGLSKGILDAVPIELPPLREQRAIAEILDTLDTTIRQTEAIIEKLKQVKQGLLHDLLTRGIDANGELRPPQSEAPHLYKESPLGWIPRDWQLKHFRDIGRAPQLGLMVRGASPEGMNVSLLKMGNLLVGNQLDLGHIEPLDIRRIDRLDDFVLADGDILFNTRNTPELVGKTCSWRDRFGATVFDNNILRMRLVPSIGSGHFIASYMGAAIGRSRLLGLATGTTSVAAIYWKDLQHFVLPLPEPQEQENIVERLDACDRRADHEKAVAGAFTALKSGLMDDLLTGRVRVTPLLA